jgi:hypothetical protein
MDDILDTTSEASLLAFRTHVKIKLGHPKVKGVHLKYKRNHPHLLKKNGKVSSPLINYHPFWNSNLHFIQKKPSIRMIENPKIIKIHGILDAFFQHKPPCLDDFPTKTRNFPMFHHLLCRCRWRCAGRTGGRAWDHLGHGSFGLYNIAMVIFL